MHERAEILTGFLGVDEELEREFECRLTESSRLAFRVAYFGAAASAGCGRRRAGRVCAGPSLVPSVERS